MNIADERFDPAGYGFGFIIRTTDAGEHTVTFEVLEVRSTDADTNEPLETDAYLEAYMKWDSCFHFWFGDEDKYLHLCGAEYIDAHIRLLKRLYAKAFEVMGRKPLDYDKAELMK